MTPRTMEMKDLPRRDASPGSGKVSTYLEKLYRTHASEDDSCLFLPSLLTMSKRLDCSPLEIHEALRKLTTRGYQFITLGLDTPVTLWYPRNKKAS